MAILYFDCFSGISGDMLVGSLIDLGVPIDYINDNISDMNLPIKLHTDKIVQKGISSTRFYLDIQNNMPLRHLPQIEEIILNSSLNQEIKENSLKVFNLLADAESTVHGISKYKVHFHEIGAADTIVDIVGTYICLEYLNIDKVYSSSLPWNSGFISISHGSYPLPAPATSLLMRGIPCFNSNADIELVTPTGAALIASLANSFGVFPESIPKAIGYGAGSKKRADGVPNLLRAVLAEPVLSGSEDSIAILETEVDDINPELFTHLHDLLINDNGVLDFFTTPIMMKKNRPGFLITVIAYPDHTKRLCELIISETSSLGIRHRLQSRHVVTRENRSIPTPWGLINVKIATLPSGSKRIKPEFSDCKELAIKHNVPLIELYSQINRLLESKDILD